MGRWEGKGKGFEGKGGGGVGGGQVILEGVEGKMEVEQVVSGVGGRGGGGSDGEDEGVEDEVG